MKLKELLNGISVVELRADPEMEIGSVVCDSRRAEKGGVFVAVEGFQTDGHAYIAPAMERGAQCVVCRKRPETDIPYALVESPRLALALMSANFYGHPADAMKIIGVTGTNGKTTTTNLIKSILDFSGEKTGLIGTNGCVVGGEVIDTGRTTPESCDLQQIFAKMRDAGCTSVVMEVSSHALCLDRVAGVTFEAGVFTNLTQDHLDFHITMENYFEAKTRLFSQSRLGVVNLDDDWGKRLLENPPCRMITYSAKSDAADFTAKNIRLMPGKTEFESLSYDMIRRAEVPIPGMFSVYNAMAAIACCVSVGVPLEDCCLALKGAKGVMGRMEPVPTGKDFHVIIDYSHTPDALEKALRAIRGVSSGRLVCLFGCGGDRDRTKRPIMGAIAAKNADFVIVTSDNPRTEEPKEIIDEILAGMKGAKTPMTVIADRREAIAWAVKNARSGDTILLAGKGHETYQEVNGQKHRLDEREEVRKALGR